ncbi:hypothetical protein M707_23990 [Arthrobacter sp. AK-YN10]|nr:hypothetical protein M707_23990 [Arthrobacter sp. AK-YN10]
MTKSIGTPPDTDTVLGSTTEGIQHSTDGGATDTRQVRANDPVRRLRHPGRSGRGAPTGPPTLQPTAGQRGPRKDESPANCWP